jgi:hypothetical protein
MDRAEIIETIKRIAIAQDGTPPGRDSFERETGVRQTEWYPHLWLRWGDALLEAGYTPNQLQVAIAPDDILKHYIAITRELGHFPVIGEWRRKARLDKGFPSHSVLGRFGGKEQLLDALSLYCLRHDGHPDVMALLAHRSPAKSQKAAKLTVITGYVYLMKSGRHHKIGRTVSVGSRERQLAIKIPIPPTTIHRIETDDPNGLEAYWHKRFAEKRGEGEWFDLSPEDVAAFKRWKRIV